MSKAWVAVVAAAALGLGCENTAQGVKQDARENKAKAEQESKQAEAQTRDERAEVKSEAKEAGAEVKDAAGDAANAVGDAARTVGAAAREAGRDIKDKAQEVAADPRTREIGNEIKAGAVKAGETAATVVRNAGPVIDAAKVTGSIKAALVADQAIDSSKIDIDTSDLTRTVTLKGTVPSAAQKAQVESIAKAKASGYTVKNNLVVG